MKSTDYEIGNPVFANFDFQAERKTVPEAADYIGTSEQFLRNDAVTKRHGIPRIKVGSKVFYLKRDLDAYLLKQRAVNVKRQNAALKEGAL